MTRGLEPSLKRALLDLARQHALLAFDYDGTLAPIVSDYEDAAIPVSTHTRLTTLAELRRCAVLSGRSLVDLRGRLAGLPLVAIVGNHGIEVAGRPLPADLRDGVQAWSAELAKSLTHLPGVRIEDKGVSLTVHYRRSPSPDQAAAAIRAAVGRLADARSFGGKAVINVVPRDAPDKATALRALLADSPGHAALYVGDDETDEVAFALAPEWPVVAVRVGLAPRTHAMHVLAGRWQMDALLDTLIEGAQA